MDKDSKKKYLVSISGPTASGKTDLSIKIAEHFNTEIISCDSRQMYREMKTGTAVPSDEELKRIKHHFIGKLSIHDYYNASMFERDIIKLLNELFKSHDIVVMTGGSGMYLDAVFYGIDDIPDPDMKIRDELIFTHQNKGLLPLLSKLKELDPKSYEQIDKNNHKRVIRALEVCLTTGKPFSSFKTRKRKNRNFETVLIALDRDREELYKRIDRRIDKMIEQGLEDEAAGLHKFKGLVPLKTIGYKEFFSYFEKEISKDEAIHLIRKNTRQYARKQINWLKRYKEMHWFNPLQYSDMIEFISKKTGKK